MFDMDQSEAWKLGYNDGYTSEVECIEEYSTCPYEEESEEWNDWMAGFRIGVEAAWNDD